MSELLVDVPLFAGIPEQELREIGHVLQRVELQPGEVAFRQGQEADGLHVVASGSVGIYARLPAGREIELARLGPGEVAGELALVDGGTRAATVRALEPTVTLVLGRADFVALATRMDPTAFVLKRRLTRIVSDRLRNSCRLLTSRSFGEDEHAIVAHHAASDELVPAEPPSAPYLLRLKFFRAFAPHLLPELLAA